MPETSAPTSYFERTGPDTFVPTVHTGGAWADDEQHVAPLLGLLVHAVELDVAERGADDGALRVSRLSYDILGKVHVEEMTLDVTVLRPGRSIELVEATAVIRGRPTVRLRAWRLAGGDTGAVAGDGADPLPTPSSVGVGPLAAHWPGGYIASLEIRPISLAPGRATVWLSPRPTLVAGEEVSDLARLVGAVDTANGVGVREDPRTWMFPNVDLTVHLHRQPVGRWLGLDTSVAFGPDGLGVTSAVLHDERGAVGRAAQSLLVRPVDDEGPTAAGGERRSP